MIGRVVCTALLMAGNLQIACRSEDSRIDVLFPKAFGINEGCEVRYLGMRVGKVEEISLQQSSPDDRPKVKVRVSVEAKSIKIRRDDKFRVGTRGLLGEAYIDIQPGSLSAQPLPPGASVRGVMPELRPESLRGYLTAMELAVELESLPEDKRQELMGAFRRLIRGARDHQLPADGHETPEPHDE